MKKLFLTAGLAAITAIGWGQSQRDINSQYNPPYAPQVFTFIEDNPNIDPLDDLKYGSMYLMKAHNHQYIALGCSILGTLAFASESKDIRSDHVLSNTLFITGGLFAVSSHILQRKGLERLYLGTNGITIKLN